jgi:hypothetical protein
MCTVLFVHEFVYEGVIVRWPSNRCNNTKHGYQISYAIEILLRPPSMSASRRDSMTSYNTLSQSCILPRQNLAHGSCEYEAVKNGSNNNNNNKSKLSLTLTRGHATVSILPAEWYIP